MLIIKNLLLLFALVFIISKSAFASCHLDCYVFYFKDTQGHIIATGEEFEKSHNVSSGCRLVKNYKSDIYQFEVYEPVTGEFSLNIKKGRNNILNGHFSGNFGSITSFDEKLRFSCNRQ